jgi:hypothetical protein
MAAGRWREIGLVLPLLWAINVGVVHREERYLNACLAMSTALTRGGCGGGFDRYA